MDNAIEIPCSKPWTPNPLAVNEWAEIPCSRKRTPELCLAWLAARGSDYVIVPMRIVPVRYLSGRTEYCVQAKQF